MDERNSQIKALMATWQAAFHDIYHVAPPTDNDGPRPEEMGNRLPEMAAERGLEHEAAVLFLTDLMYWQGSSYTGAHWVCWAVAAPGMEKPTAHFVALEKGGWQRQPAPAVWEIRDRRTHVDA
jgi:hypothetical protein